MDNKGREEGRCPCYLGAERHGWPRGGRGRAELPAGCSPWTAEGGRRNMLVVDAMKEKETGKEKVAEWKISKFARERAPIYRRNPRVKVSNGPNGLGWAGPKHSNGPR
jgi:hypothetical protein